jgi:Cdc6-like AAA superfamily ATPase
LQQNDIISRREKGTGQWLLDSTEFQGWLQGSDKTLFCPGIPGSGKTMVAAIATDYLCRTMPIHEVGIAYIYCNYKAQDIQNARNLLALILKQLAQGNPAIMGIISRLYKDHSKRKTRPSLDEVVNAFHSACSEFLTVYIVVDALDEFIDRNDERGRLIRMLRDVQHKSDVRLMATSRFIPEVEKEFKLAKQLEVRASDEDIRRYIAGQIHRLPKVIQNDNSLRDIVQDKVAEKVGGM